MIKVWFFNDINTEFIAGLCAKSPCQNGGTCVPNGANDYDCFCTADYDDGEDCSACKFCFVITRS